MFVSVILGSIIVSVVTWIIFRTIFRRPESYPEEYPFQHTYWCLTKREVFLDFMLELLTCLKQKNNSKTFSINVLGLPNIVVTNSIPAITYVLKENFSNFGKGPTFKSRFQGLLGDGIFNVDGDKWYHHRKVSSHLFNLNKFRSTILATFNEHSDILLDILKKKAKSPALDGSWNPDPVNFQELMFRFTLDSIGKIAFGFDIASLRLTEDGQRMVQVQFADDFDFVQYETNESFVDPTWRLKYYLTPLGSKLRAALSRIDKFAFQVVRQRRKESEEVKSKNSKSRDNDLLGIYLSREKEEKSNEPEGSGPALDSGPLSDKDLRDIVLNFVIAGRDTTAQALTWTFLRLALHRDIQARAREEIRQTLSDHPSLVDEHGWLSYEALSSLTYLEAVCLEVLRLYPSVPKEAKHVYKDDVLPDESQTKVHSGDLLIFSPWAMGRSEELWERPYSFEPERFLPPNSKKPSPFRFTAFQAGPRICLGRDLALLEMKAVICRLLLTFDFRMAQDTNVTYLNTITLPVKGSLMLIAVPLKP